jgi:IclR family pca regulon transcriptional regulator
VPANDSPSDASVPTVSQSLQRGLLVLSSFSAENSTMGIAALARCVNLSKSTVHRYASSLTQLGYLQQDPETKEYALGPRAVDLGFAAITSMELTRTAARPLQALADETGYTVSMAILDGGDIVYVDRHRSARAGFRIELNLQVGSRLPAYCTAMGKVLLAHKDAVALRAILDRTDLARRGPKTVTAREQLMSSLARTQTSGIAFNDEELAPGLRSLAAPVRDRSGAVVAAVNIAVHLSAWNASMEAVAARLETPLRRTTADISARLGYRALAHED